MSFAVLHVTKFAGSGSGGIGAHIDRKHTPKNADPARTELNREIIPPRSSSMKKDIDERIQEGYTSTRKIRTDAVRAVGVILSGSHEQMKKIQASGRLDEWCQANLKFAQDKFGKDNLIRFTLHMDEKTPHIHAVFTPIKDGKLHYKSFVDGKKGLTQLQDDYAREMERFGLNRGLKQTRTKHTTTREYYAKLEAVPPVELKKNLLGQPKPGEEERLTEEFKKMKAAAIEKERESGRFQGAFRAERQKTDKLTEEIEKKVNLVAKLENMIKRLVVNKDLNLLKQLEQVFTKPGKSEVQKQPRGKGI
jgi:hypothetical protein